MPFLPDFENKTLFMVLFTLAFVVALIYLYKILSKDINPYKEGFVQMQKFILKRDADAYDEFYAHIYDKIHLPEDRCKNELKLILEATSADETSVFLDVGSGTGETLKTLNDVGARCFGIDKSEAMVKTAKRKCLSGADPSESGANSEADGEVSIKNADVLDAMNYDRQTFSHILCLYHTIYEIENKAKFFQNCRYWLKNGGVLVVHLVNKQKFNTVVPAAHPDMIDNPQKYVSDRITKSSINFIDFSYDSKYDIQDGPVSIIMETFTDTATHKIRQNERRLFMESEDAILKTALNNGFSLHGKINLETVNNDEHQSLYLLI
jgi:SAM-dependent methyltransferase